MKITLRKAGKLRNKMHTKLTTLAQELNLVNVSVNIYDSIDKNYDVLLTASNKYQATLAQYVTLSEALVKLRTAIATANEQSGINLLLANQAGLVARKSILESMAHRVDAVIPERTSYDSLVNGQLVLNAGTSRSYTEKTIHFGILTAKNVSEAELQLVELQSTLESIQDELEERNVNVHLTLDTEIVSVLKANNII